MLDITMNINKFAEVGRVKAIVMMLIKNKKIDINNAVVFMGSTPFVYGYAKGMWFSTEINIGFVDMMQKVSKQIATIFYQS